MNTQYKIKIDYETGDSFGHNNEIDYIDLEWQNLDIVKENLQRIKEHYEQYKELESLRRPWRDNDVIFEANKSKPWFVGKLKPAYKVSDKKGDYNAISEVHIEKLKEQGKEIIWFYDKQFAQNCIKLKLDNGNEFQMSCFWCGYFETLHSAEIEVVKEDDKDMRI